MPRRAALLAILGSTLPITCAVVTARFVVVRKLYDPAKPDALSIGELYVMDATDRNLALHAAANQSTTHCAPNGCEVPGSQFASAGVDGIPNVCECPWMSTP